MYEFLLTTLCPALGLLLANIMYASPLQAVLTARKEETLGELNPVPWVLIVLNTFAWTMYGCLRKDYFVFWSNFPGLILGIFYNLTAMTLLAKGGTNEDIQRLRKMEVSIMCGAIFWGIVIMTTSLVLGPNDFEREVAAQLVGYLGCFLGLAYYISPLSTIQTVCKTRDPSSLYLPMIISNMLCAFLWLIYGWAKSDPLIWAPNGLGLGFGVLQAFVYSRYAKCSIKDVDKRSLLASQLFHSDTDLVRHNIEKNISSEKNITKSATLVIHNPLFNHTTDTEDINKNENCTNTSAQSTA